ncbi:MAG: DUF2279 domain-containing protein [Candidatus Marinimicrobia bacterium]|nr:DUF2279 domain-containing protein [Candidatus Neomarinimicrobiota bacterium]
MCNSITNNCKFNLFAILLFFILLNPNLSGQSDSTKINPSRIFIVNASTIGGLGGSYYYMKNAWWSETKNNFHFDKGPDQTYALNLDKYGHFFGGLVLSEVYQGSLRWAGMKEEKAIWYGAVLGIVLHMGIELKDGYAPYWGFSTMDLVSGSFGACIPVVNYYFPKSKSVGMKFSYFKEYDTYWKLERQRNKKPYKYSWQDDYVNQTYWFSFDLSQYNKLEVLSIPKWLCIAIGVGLDNTQFLNNTNTKTGGNLEYYIAIDYNTTRLLKNWDSSFGKKVKNILKYIKLPAPTIRISPSFEFYPFYL